MSSPSPDSNETTVSPLGSADIAYLGKSAESVNEVLLALGYGVLTETIADLPALQSVVDSGAADEHLWLQQNLGIAFGNILAESLDLRWAIVTDSYGTVPALHVPGKSIYVYPLDMISKRIEDGDEVDFEHLLNVLKEHVERLKAELAG